MPTGVYERVPGAKRASTPVLERARAKVLQRGPDECWPWTGAVGQWGHPRIAVDKKSGAVPRILLWEAEHGPIPEGRTLTTTCKQPACMNPAHWALRAYGDDAARFWEKVRKEPGDACWEWTASLAKHGGYAQMKRNGKKIRASRFAYEIEHGPIASPLLFVCHTCDNPKCVRPSHLFLGTVVDNNADMTKKGRRAQGERHRLATQAARERGWATLRARRICTTSASPKEGT